MTNFKFNDKTEWNSTVINYMMCGEIAEITLTKKTEVKAHIERNFKDGYIVVVNGNVVKTAKKFSTIETFINNIK